MGLRAGRRLSVPINCERYLRSKLNHIVCIGEYFQLYKYTYYVNAKVLFRKMEEPTGERFAYLK